MTTSPAPSQHDHRHDHKFVVVLRDQLEPGRALNVCGHLSLGLVAKAARDRPETLEEMAFVNYADADGGRHEPISALGLIVLRGKASWLTHLRSELEHTGLIWTDFVDTMIEGSSAEQLARTAATSAADLAHLGLAAFGPRSVLDPMTKRFSLWR